MERSESLEKLVETSDVATETETIVKTKQPPQEEWAVSVDVNTPVDDFYKRVPDMAHEVFFWMNF